MVRQTHLTTVTTHWDRLLFQRGYPRRRAYERDTHRLYTASDDFPFMVYDSQDTVTDRGFYEHQDSSIAHLFEDEFAKTTPTCVYPVGIYNDLEDLVREEYGKDPLINTNVTGVLSNVGSFSGYNVARFNGTDASLHLPLDTLFGTDSFLMGGWFRPQRNNTNETLIMYGDSTSINVTLGFTTNDELKLVISTGSNAAHAFPFPAGHIRDRQWHYIGVLIDKHRGKGYVIATNGTYENAIFEEFTLPAMNSLDYTGGAFAIGSGYRNGVIGGSNFSGDVSNVQLYQWENEVDYNVLPLVFAGIREGCARDITITDNINIDSRLNHSFVIEGDEGAYTYALVNLDAGLYDIFFTQHYSPDGGNYSIFLDNINRGFYDTYSSTGFNNFNGFIDDVNLPKGWHFLKLRMNTKNTDSTHNRVKLSQIKFNKKDGDSNLGGAGHFLMLGDELRNKSNSLVLAPSTGSPYNNALIHDIGSIVPDNTFAEGEVFLAGGLWKLDLNLSQANDYGIVELLINGRKIIDLDGYSSALNFDVAKSVYAVLHQGRNTIRVQVNGKNSASSGYRMLLHCIRGELQSNTCFDGNTIVASNDRDFEIVEGDDASNNTSLFTNSLFGVERVFRSTTSKSVVKRWFTGGVYEVNYHIRKHPTGGRQKITIENDSVNFDNITVFDSVDFTNAVITNSIETALVKIPRGYHYVTFDNLGAGTQDITNPMSFLNFTLLSRKALGGDVDLIGEENGLVRIGEFRARRDGNSAVINFGGVVPELYDEIKVIFNGRSVDRDMTVGMTINDLTSLNYRKTGDIKVNGTEHTQTSANRAELVMCSTGLLTNVRQTFTCEVEMFFGVHETTGKWISHGFGRTSTHAVGREDYSWLLTGDNIPEIKVLRFTSSGADWSNLSDIIVYGRRTRG